MSKAGGVGGLRGSAVSLSQTLQDLGIMDTRTLPSVALRVYFDSVIVETPDAIVLWRMWARGESSLGGEVD